jgi:3-oxoadipate enol-lactonase
MTEPLATTVIDEGAEATIVLLHSLALDRSIWNGFVDQLNGSATVIAVDLPGHGDSHPAASATIESMADDVANTLSSLGRSRIVLVGMSLGGSVALATAIRHPSLVRALGLIDTTAWYGPNAVADWESRVDRATSSGLESMRDFQLDRWFSDGFVEREPETCRHLLQLFVSNQVESYAATCRALGSMDLRPGLGSVVAPTVVVVGERDEATPLAYAETLANGIAGATLTVVPGGRHLTAIEHSGDVLVALRPILPGSSTTTPSAAGHVPRTT